MPAVFSLHPLDQPTTTVTEGTNLMMEETSSLMSKEGSEAMIYLIMQQGGGDQESLSLFSTNTNTNTKEMIRLRTANETLEHYAQRLEQTLVSYEQQCKKYQYEIEDLEQEVFEVMKARDQTPGALLFFTALHDATFIPSLQQMSLQLHHLQNYFVYPTTTQGPGQGQGDQEMDFFTLKRRIQVCFTHLPNVEKMIEKYGLLYKQWASHRIQYFSERKLRGNAADNLASCPLCFRDLGKGGAGHGQSQSQGHHGSVGDNNSNGRGVSHGHGQEHNESPIRHRQRPLQQQQQQQGGKKK